MYQALNYLRMAANAAAGNQPPACSSSDMIAG